MRVTRDLGLARADLLWRLGVALGDLADVPGAVFPGEHGSGQPRATGVGDGSLRCENLALLARPELPALMRQEWILDELH